MLEKILFKSESRNWYDKYSKIIQKKKKNLLTLQRDEPTSLSITPSDTFKKADFYEISEKPRHL